MNVVINEELARAVYEANYKDVCSFELFLNRMINGFDLLRKNQEMKESKKKPFFEREQLVEIKMALQYNQARLIQLLKETENE